MEYILNTIKDLKNDQSFIIKILNKEDAIFVINYLINNGNLIDVQEWISIVKEVNNNQIVVNSLSIYYCDRETVDMYYSNSDYDWDNRLSKTYSYEYVSDVKKGKRKKLEL